MTLGLRLLPLLSFLVSQQPFDDGTPNDPQKDLPNISGFFNSAPTTSGQKEQEILNYAGFTDTFSNTSAFVGGASAAALTQVVYELNKEMSSKEYKAANHAYRSSNQAVKNTTTIANSAAKFNPSDSYFEKLKVDNTAAQEAAETARGAAEAAETAAREAAEAAETAAEATAKEAAKAADEAATAAREAAEAAEAAAREAAEALKEANKARAFFTSSGNALSEAQKAQQEALASLKANPKGSFVDAAKKITNRVTKLEDQAEAKWYKQIGQYASKFKNKPKAYIIPGAALAGLAAEMMFGDDRSDNQLNCKFNTDSSTLDFTVSGQNGDLSQASNFRFKVSDNQLVLSQNTEPITEPSRQEAIIGSRGSSTEYRVSTKDNGNTFLRLAEIANENQKLEIQKFLLANFPDSSKVPEELKRLYENLNPSTPGAPAATSGSNTASATATSGAPAAAAAGAAGAAGAPANGLISVLNKIDALEGNSPEVKLLKEIRPDLAFYSESFANLDQQQKKNAIFTRAEIYAGANRITFDVNKLNSIIDGLFNNQ